MITFYEIKDLNVPKSSREDDTHNEVLMVVVYVIELFLKRYSYCIHTTTHLKLTFSTQQ